MTMPFKYLCRCSKNVHLFHPSKLKELLGNPVGSSCRTITSAITLQNFMVKGNGKNHICLPSPALLQTAFHRSQSSSTSNPNEDKIAVISSQMNMRLLNENSFLSWCRNAYLSSVVGIAMMEQATSIMAQSAGFAAFAVGGMNVFWGTSCHLVNLVRLRQASGMSQFTLLLNICGSLFHCLLWLCILTCYIGFLDENKEKIGSEDDKRKDLPVTNDYYGR